MAGWLAGWLAGRAAAASQPSQPSAAGYRCSDIGSATQRQGCIYTRGHWRMPKCCLALGASQPASQPASRPASQPSVVCIDIGGGTTASVAALWRLVESYGACLAPRLFIVKAFKLAELLRRCEGVGGGGG